MNYDNRQINHNESEQSVIGGLLLLQDMSQEAAQKVFSMLKPESFTLMAHKVMFDAIRKLAANGNEVDAITLDAYLKNAGQSENAGGFAYAADCMKISNISNFVAHAAIVRDAAVNRKMQQVLNNGIAILGDADGRTADQKLGEIQSMLEALSQRAINNKPTGLTSFADISDSWLQEVDARYNAIKNGEILGHTTGIIGLDDMLKPKHIPDGSLVVVGARPKMGKTAFLCSLAEHVALDAGKAVALFSLEMMNTQVIERLVSRRANVDSTLFYGNSSEDGWARASAAIGEFNESKLFMDDTPGVTLEHVQREARKLNKKEKLGMIAVDYLTLMGRDSGGRNDLELSKITIGLKNLAKELNCIVVLLTQLNRDLEKRPDKRPLPSDSRDTGSIEQDCDLWIGLYRDEKYNPDSSMKGLTEILVRLNRHGNTGMVPAQLVNGSFVEWTGPVMDDNNGHAQDDDDY